MVPVARLQDIERERIYFSRRTADAIGIVFDHKQHRQFLFFREADRFKEISLACGRVANCGHNEILFAIQLHAPGHAAGRQELRTGGRRHTPNVQVHVAVMRRHHAAAAARGALGKIFERELFRRHAATKNQTAIAIIRNDVIVRLHLHGNSSERFVTHPGNVKVTFALTIQILLSQIRVPALQNRFEKPKLIFFAERGH